VLTGGVVLLSVHAERNPHLAFVLSHTILLFGLIGRAEFTILFGFCQCFITFVDQGYIYVVDSMLK
jgi:hypothetical protein